MTSADTNNASMGVLHMLLKSFVHGVHYRLLSLL